MKSVSKLVMLLVVVRGEKWTKGPKGPKKQCSLEITVVRML